jgi:cell wall-associated NlpC family hydrolase
MPFVEEVPGPVQSGLAVFQYGRNFSHGAICTAKGTYIHASGRNGFGIVKESNLSSFRIGEAQRKVRYFDVRV